MKRNYLFTLIIIIIILLKSSSIFSQTKDSSSFDKNSNGHYFRDIYPDTWAGTDDLGRTMPDYSEVGSVKKDHRRVVGIFYITWHQDKLYNLKSSNKADVTKILATDPDARLNGYSPAWGKYSSYHWGEPELGYFLSKDEYVIRHDMSMLADAGVDVVIMDVTNAVEYWSEWDVIFSVMEKMKVEGNKVPKFCFWAFNGPVITVVQNLYDKIYKKDKYKDLWFYWDDKPLLLYNGKPDVDANGQGVENPNPHFDATAKTDTNNPRYENPQYTEKFYKDYTKEVKSFFTLRTMWWGYYKWGGKRFVGTDDNWSFGYDLGDSRVRSMNSNDLVSTHCGKKEEAAVTPAQHPYWLIGKSWSRGSGEPKLNEYDLPVPTYVPWLGKVAAHPEGYGIYFQERWDEAIKADPQFIYINDWNEWTAGKFDPEVRPPVDPNKKEKTTQFMRRESNYYFVDQYNSEFNRDIQPMKDGYTDNYYMQMVENIRHYKGVRPIPVSKGLSQINIDGDFTDWSKVKVKYRDTKGDTFHRDYNGYGGMHYVDTSGRNDIVTCKVAVDKQNVDFYAETNDSLTSYTGHNWMLLLIDADKNSNTGWHGYDFLINKKINGKTTTLMRYNPNSPNDPWAEVAQLNYRYNGKRLEIAVPRKLLGLQDDNFIFDFKWSDNPVNLKDPISFCISGDTAPNRRFNYRFIWEK